jgi:hypothetical protein
MMTGQVTDKSSSHPVSDFVSHANKTNKELFNKEENAMIKLL